MRLLNLLNYKLKLAPRANQSSRDRKRERGETKQHWAKMAKNKIIRINYALNIIKIIRSKNRIITCFSIILTHFWKMFDYLNISSWSKFAFSMKKNNNRPVYRLGLWSSKSFIFWHDQLPVKAYKRKLLTLVRNLRLFGVVLYDIQPVLSY